MDHRRLTIRIAGLAAGLLCTAALVAPPASANPGKTSTADASPGKTSTARGPLSGFAAFLWSTSITPSDLRAYYLYTSLANSVTDSQSGTGQYQVVFDGLSRLPRQPTAQVTAYDATTDCNVAMLHATSTTMTVDVDCWAFTGTPSDASFDLLVGQAPAKPPGVVDYALVEKNGHHAFSFNSSHQHNSVTHLGTGRYEVTMGGKATRGVTGTVKVTGTASGGNCTIAGWHGSPAGERILVDCFKASGARQDQMFFVSYARRSNLTGWRGATTADAFANLPATASYRPRLQDDNTPGAQVQVARQGLGQYLVTFDSSAGPNSVAGGNVQVTPVSSSDRHCTVVNWSTGTNPAAQIECFDNQANLADTPFTVQWINDAPPA